MIDNREIVAFVYQLFLIGNGIVFKRGEVHLLYTKSATGICRCAFRIILNKGRLEITFLQYAVWSIFGPFFAGVVYGLLLMYCVIVLYGVILK